MNPSAPEFIPGQLCLVAIPAFFVPAGDKVHVANLKRPRFDSLSDSEESLISEAKAEVSAVKSVKPGLLQVQIEKRDGTDETVSSIESIVVSEITYTGSCPGCTALSTLLLQERQDARDRGLIRQAALNLEFEIKIRIVNILPEEEKKEYMQARVVNPVLVSISSLRALEARAKHYNMFKTVLNSMRLTTTDYYNMIASATAMKALMTSEAHPIHDVDGSLASYASLQASLNRRAKEFPGALVYGAYYVLSTLLSVRQDAGTTQYLVNNHTTN